MENNEVYLVDTSFSDIYKPDLSQGDVVMYVPIATEQGHGVTRPGDGIKVEAGVISVDSTIFDGDFDEINQRIDSVEGETEDALSKKLDKRTYTTDKAQVYVKNPDGSQVLLDITEVGGGAVDEVTTVLDTEDKVKVVAIANTNGIIDGDEILDFFTLNVYEGGD